MALTRPRAYQIYDIDYKQAVRVVTVANITLSGGAPNSVDGVNLSLNDRVLVTGQTSGIQNGIYYVTTLGTGANGTWTRSIDTDTTGELLSGTIVMVTEGNNYADTQWKLTTDDPITIGVTSLTFVQNYSTSSISSGNSNVVVAANSSVTISSAGVANVIKVDATNISVTANIVPTANVTYSLGTATARFKDIYLANNSIYLGNLTIAGDSTQLTVNGANVITSTGGNISVSGNVTGGNILTAGSISASGNITGNYILGNGSQLTGINATTSKIFNGTSEANIGTSGGNANISVGGTSNVAVFATTGEYVTGLISATGNITGSYFIGNGSLLTGISGGGGSSFVYTANTAPPASGNTVGAQWYNTSTGALYEYQSDGTSTYWVDITGPTVANTVTSTGDSLSPFLLMGA